MSNISQQFLEKIDRATVEFCHFDKGTHGGFANIPRGTKNALFDKTVFSAFGTSCHLSTAGTSKFGGLGGIALRNSAATISYIFDFGFGNVTPLKKEFTVDFWINPQSITGTHVYLYHRNGADSYSWLNIQAVAGKLQFYMSTNNSAWNVTGTMGTMAIGNWYHAALCRQNGGIAGTADAIHYFMDGSAGLNSPVAIGAGTSLQYGNSYLAVLGYNGVSANAYMQELHVQFGKAQWTGKFTPPTKQYQYDGFQTFGAF